MNARVQGPISGSALFARRRRIGSGVRPVMVTSPASVATHRHARHVTHKAEPRRRVPYSWLLFAITVSAAAFAIGAVVDKPPTLMSNGEYVQLQRNIISESRLALAHCRDKSVSEKDVCKAMARADERVKKAGLKARYYGTVSAQEEVHAARVRGAYEVARARCGVQAGEQRMSCLRAAREERNKVASS